MITAQLGLLEDDITYRLALLAANVLQPLKDVYPNIVILSGFRQTNSGIGQHEMGEAVDLQIQNQTPELLYEVADYIQKNLNFDQLVLNFSNIGKGEPWIHVSFSPDSLRGQVLTKDFADNFHDGLFLVEPLTGEDAAQALRDQQEQDTAILAELTNIQTRQERLGQTPEIIADETGDPNSGGSGGSGGDGGPGGDDAHVALVRCVRDALMAAGLNLDSGNPAFEITKRVAWLLRDEQAGLLIKPAGENVVQWNGYPLSASRLCFPNGQLFKVVGDAGPGGQNNAQYNGDGFVEPSRYVAAMDPGTDITTEWSTCSL
jgi:hypothetical protein